MMLINIALAILSQFPNAPEGGFFVSYDGTTQLFTLEFWDPVLMGAPEPDQATIQAWYDAIPDPDPEGGIVYTTVDVNGVACSITNDDVTEMAFVWMKYQLDTVGFPDTVVTFANASELTLTAANFIASYTTWIDFRRNLLQPI